MQIPVIRGTIDRRILVNFRVDPDVLARLLPPPFRPKLVNGAGMAGVCLSRLTAVRPQFLPPLFGVSSENAAHRVAVRWEQHGETKEGVFVPRRDTSSRLNTLADGRLFPGVHHHAAFRVREHDDHYRIEMNSDDRQSRLLVEGHAVHELYRTSVFGSLREASAFFGGGRAGLLGHGGTGPVRRPGALQLQLAGAAPGRRKGGIQFF
jgi:hypothetical protein